MVGLPAGHLYACSRSPSYLVSMAIALFDTLIVLMFTLTAVSIDNDVNDLDNKMNDDSPRFFHK